jgi:hypothetical protein
MVKIVFTIFRDPGEARTPDPLIKSQLLYQLSYEVIISTRKLFIYQLPSNLTVFLSIEIVNGKTDHQPND